MSTIQFSFTDSLIPDGQKQPLLKKLVPEIERIAQSQEEAYGSVYASTYCPFDELLRKNIHATVTSYTAKKIATIVVVGIGGSTMGTRAIAQMLFNSNRAHKPNLIFLETVDPDRCARTITMLEQQLKAGKHVLVNVVTKSGTTTETIVNFELLLALLKKYHPTDFHEYVVVTTNEGSPLEQLAHVYNFGVLSIPLKVGGRFSVFSAVGLFPLAMAGWDIDELLAGARHGFALATEIDCAVNPAAQSAALKVAHYRNGINLFDLFVFSLDLQDVGLFYRQIFAESLGKKNDIHGKIVEIGMTPLISVGSTDLHSVGQLYLGGPRSMFTTFIEVEKTEHNPTIPNLPEFEACVKNIQNRPVTDTMQAILRGTQQAYEVDKRPFMRVVLPEKNAYSCGTLLQLYMIEVMYMGYLLDINPFDQPDVERYKERTRKLLAQ